MKLLDTRSANHWQLECEIKHLFQIPWLSTPGKCNVKFPDFPGFPRPVGILVKQCYVCWLYIYVILHYILLIIIDDIWTLWCNLNVFDLWQYYYNGYTAVWRISTMIWMGAIYDMYHWYYLSCQTNNSDPKTEQVIKKWLLCNFSMYIHLLFSMYKNASMTDD